MLCIFMAWLYPFFEGSVPDAMQQIVALGCLAIASLLFGISSISVVPVTIIVAFVVAIIAAPAQYHGGQIAGIAGVVLACLGCCVGGNLQRNPSGLAWLLVAVVGAAFINALEGLLQWFGLANELWPWVVETGRRGIAFGAFRQTNLFATFLCSGVVCAAWLLHLRRITNAMAWFLLFVMVFGVAASGSRTGGLELAALSVAGLVFRKQQTGEVTRVLVGSVFLFGLATVVLPFAANLHGFGFVSGAERVANVSKDARLLIWSNVLSLIQERPWTGWGWLGMGYGHYVTLYGHRFNELLDHAHNLPLQITVEFGLPFALTFFGVLGWAVYTGKPWLVIYSPPCEKEELAPNRSFAWALLLLIVGLHSMLERPLWYFGFLFLTGFAVGYLLLQPSEKSIEKIYGIWSIRLATAGAVTLILLALVAWQQYDKMLQIYKAPFNDHEAQLVAINNASEAWLFRGHLDFIKIGMVDVTLENAKEVKQSAESLLHFSAEPIVIQPLLLSLWYLHETNELKLQAVRFCRAFPASFQRWSQFYATHPILQASGNLTKFCQPSYLDSEGDASKPIHFSVISDITTSQPVSSKRR